MQAADQTTVWALKVPSDYCCAQLSNLWIKRPFLGNCPECGRHRYEDAPSHILVEWEVGSDRICDFTFTNGAIVLKTEIADELLKRFAGFKKGEVRMFDHPALYRPNKITKRMRKCVWLPYDGPELCYLLLTKEIELHSSSTVEIESNCTTCKTLIYREFKGIEEKDSVHHSRRVPGKGFFFDKRLLGGASFFRPKHTGFTLCTNEVKQFMEQRGYGNIEFLEVGNVLATKPTRRKRKIRTRKSRD